MNFGSIDSIVLFGGSRCLAELAQKVQQEGEYRLYVYTCQRQLEEVIYPDGTTLADVMTSNSISHRTTDDINQDEQIRQLITATTLGLGLGEAWSFSRELIDLFEGKLLDLMGIQLPQYRGGAHYTWQILRGNRIGGCNLQVINEDMVQGEYDSGEIVKSAEYFFPAGARTPDDYFQEAVEQEIRFLEEFLAEVTKGVDFHLTRLQESFSIFFPRLSTETHGMIDWNWDTQDIERFICAFDDPYNGASSFVGDLRVHLKSCCAETNDGPFHPFQCGLIYRIVKGILFVATRSGTMVVKRALDGEGRDISESLKVGQRFVTPAKFLERALSYSAIYDTEGLVPDA